MLFDMLAFKNDVAFWKENKSLEGLSLRTIVINTFFQVGRKRGREGRRKRGREGGREEACFTPRLLEHPIFLSPVLNPSLPPSSPPVRHLPLPP